MPSPIRTPLEYLDRVLGNREPIGGLLLENDGTPINLTGATVLFRMVSMADASLKVEAAAAIVSASSGRVSYEPTADDVNALGEFAFYWIINKAGAQPRRVPYDGARNILTVKSETETQ